MNRLPPPAASRRTLVGLAAGAAISALASARPAAAPPALRAVGLAPERQLPARLALAGVLRSVRGVIWGTCHECEPDAGFGSATIPDLLDDHVKPLGVPAWRGALIGHIGRQFTLPVGGDVEIDATAGSIRMLAPAVR